jgi:hypothetical protein
MVPPSLVTLQSVVMVNSKHVLSEARVLLELLAQFDFVAAHTGTRVVGSVLVAVIVLVLADFANFAVDSIAVAVAVAIVAVVAAAAAAAAVVGHPLVFVPLLLI